MSYYRQGPYRPSGINIGVPRLTPYVKRLIIACAAVWVGQRLIGGILGFSLDPLFGLVPGLVVGKAFLWQLFTSMFLHGTFLHLLFNMLVLWMFGGDLEQMWGGKSFLTYYLVCGVGAAIAASLLGAWQDPATLSWTIQQLLARPPSTTIGASGAVFGIIVAFGMVFSERTVLFMLIFPMKARTFALIFFVIAFLGTIDASAGGVSHISHLGGALTGYLYLKKAWRIKEFIGELRWKFRRRRFRVMPPQDPDDRWLN